MEETASVKMEKINTLIDRLSQVSDGLQAMLGAEGLRRYTPRQLAYIKLVGSEQGVTVSKIASMLNIRKPTASFVVNELIGQSILKKVQSSTDKRYFGLELTEKGEQVYRQYLDINSQVFSRMQLFFSPAEIDGLCSQMEKMKKITDYLQMQYL